jgi:hypothetical protein
MRCVVLIACFLRLCVTVPAKPGAAQARCGGDGGNVEEARSYAEGKLSVI